MNNPLSNLGEDDEEPEVIRWREILEHLYDFGEMHLSTDGHDGLYRVLPGETKGWTEGEVEVTDEIDYLVSNGLVDRRFTAGEQYENDTTYKHPTKAVIDLQEKGFQVSHDLVMQKSQNKVNLTLGIFTFLLVMNGLTSLIVNSADSSSTRLGVAIYVGSIVIMLLYVFVVKGVELDDL